LFYLAQIFHSNLITFSRSKEAFTQGDWHDFTDERWNPFQGTHQSRVGILCLTIILLILIKQGISRYMTFVYREPRSECELHLDDPFLFEIFNFPQPRLSVLQVAVSFTSWACYSCGLTSSRSRVRTSFRCSISIMFEGTE
jgi:hypothetical protein